MSRQEAPGAQPSLRVDQIVEATRVLFLRYGYRRTSMDDIAREAGVAKATLYLHFAGKEDMFRAMLRHFRLTMNDRCDVAEARDGAVEARLVALLYAYYGTMLEWFGDAAHLSELKAFAAEHAVGQADDAVPAFGARLRRMLDQAADRDEIDPARLGLSMDDVTQTLLFAATGAKLAQKDGATKLRQVLEPLVALTIGGLRRI